MNPMSVLTWCIRTGCHQLRADCPLRCDVGRGIQIFSVNSAVMKAPPAARIFPSTMISFIPTLLEISCGNDYTAKVIPQDINVWTARLFLGDADGFSILYYQAWIRWYIGPTSCLPVGPARHCNWSLGQGRCGCGRSCRSKYKPERALCCDGGRSFPM